MTTISAQIIADSIGENAPRLTTMLLRYPRCIHAEFMTHRVFSRNASSSRAIPVEKLIQDVLDDPFVPLVWGKNQKGMQGGEENNALVDIDWPLDRKSAWLFARDDAVLIASEFAKAGYHKQIVNRLLEPFAHITVVVTSTQWSNFFALRHHPDAEPHISLLAGRMLSAMEASAPHLLRPGDWHLPFVTNADRTRANAICAAMDANPDGHWSVPSPGFELIKLSVARCASTSYKTVDGFDMTLERAIALHDKLVASVPLHASPCEHQAKVDENGTLGRSRWLNPMLGGNLGPGWVQYRKTLAGECM